LAARINYLSVPVRSAQLSKGRRLRRRSGAGESITFRTAIHSVLLFMLLLLLLLLRCIICFPPTSISSRHELF